MSIILPALGIAFAAFCIWLGVRIVNRRERWAKWTLATTVGALVLYVLSFGPMVCLKEHGWLSETPLEIAQMFYYPMDWLYVFGPEPVAEVIGWYVELWGWSH